MNRSRPRALLGWEFGAGLEHVRRLTTIGVRLSELGWEVSFALRELNGAPDLLRLGFRVLQSPIPPSLVVGAERFRAGSYGEIVGSYGFGNEDVTTSVLAAWDELIGLVDPHLIVADYSPFLSLAAYGRTALMSIGDGFVMPPAHLDTFPLIHEGGTRPFDHAKAVQTINTVQKRRGGPPVRTLPSIVGGDAQIVCTFPELDAYRRMRRGVATGPLKIQADPLPPPERESIFFYLAADYRFTWRALEAIAASGIEAKGYIRSGPPERKRQFAEQGVFFYDKPPPIADALAGCSMIVHHGGVGTSEAALSAGRKQLLVPRHLEQTINAKSLVNLGVGVVLISPFSLDAAKSAIQGLRTRTQASTSARSLAAQLAQREKDRSLHLIATACEESLYRRAAAGT